MSRPASLTPTDRCRRTIAGEPTDRAPAYIPAIACDVASELLGRRVHTGTGSLHHAEILAWSRGAAAHDDFVAQLEVDLTDLYTTLDIDVYREPWRMNVRPARRLDDCTFVLGDPAGTHAVWQYHPESGDFGVLRDSRPPASPEQHLRHELEAGSTTDAEMVAAAREQAEHHQRLHERFGDRFFVLGPGASIAVSYAPESLMALALYPQQVARLMMRQCEQGVRVVDQWARLDGVAPVIEGGGDLAGVTGPFYSPDSFRAVVLPAYRRLVQRCNSLGLHYLFRSDGDLWPLADMLFGDAACPGLGEGDRDAGMTVAALRRHFPALVIWGNMSSAFLRDAAATAVRDAARRILEESEGRGYFQGCSNAIVKGTPARNVEALFAIR